LGSPATIPVEQLLAPLSDDAPVGENLRLDSSPAAAYYSLKDKRSTARAAERKAEIDASSSAFPPEWQQVLSVAQELLGTRSKDLEVAAWLTEALVRVNGFAGLRDGFALCRGLLEQYWDTFWSLEDDEEGAATRLAPLAGLNGVGTEGTLLQPIRKVPVALSQEGAVYAAYHYDDARAIAQVDDPDARARREANAEVTMERFMAAVEATGGKFYVELLADIDEALAGLAALGALLQERAGRDAPSMTDIRSALSAVRDTVEYFSKDIVARTLVQDAPDGEPGSAPAGVKGRGGGAVRGREEALRTLLQVAEYFKQHEPHSPIAASLEELVRRARLPFPELLAELVPDPSAWRYALTSAGIKPPAEGG
jgi:type VI secretion system protein ImpA